VARGEIGGSSWEVASRPLAPALAPFVRERSGYAERTPGALRRRELPGPRVVVILEMGPPLAVTREAPGASASCFRGGFVAGLDDGPTMTEHAGFQAGIQLDLTPIGARLVFGVPMSELAGRLVALDDVLPREHRGLASALGAMPTWDARFDHLDRVLQRLVASARTDTRAVGWALRAIEERGGDVDVRGLVKSLGYSAKHTIRLFREQAGVPPKLYARLVRFQRLVDRLKEGPPGTWGGLAAELGYYDQSHLARDVKQFAGTTPTGAKALLVDLTHLEVNSFQDGAATGT
jgi:AraC-like DNA-binding protein